MREDEKTKEESKQSSTLLFYPLHSFTSHANSKPIYGQRYLSSNYLINSFHIFFHHFNALFQNWNNRWASRLL